MIELIKPYISEIVIFISGLGAWVFERNKRRQEIKKAESDLKQSETNNNKSIMDLYQEALNDLKERYDTNLKELKNEYDEKFKVMEQRYNRLKKAFEDYKRKHEKI